MFRTMLATFVLATGLLAQAQIRVTAYPQESLTNGNGNLSPFGCVPPGSVAESHVQILILPQYLPGPGAVLLGLAAHAEVPANLVYPSLQITMSPTTSTSLGAGFAGNLPAPQLVLSATNLNINWQTGLWTPITLGTPYVHDGVSGLVIDIQKIVNPTTLGTNSTVNNTARNDFPAMAIAFGGIGSGASNATTATAFVPALSVELQWSGVPTVKLKSDRGGAMSNQFPLGGSIDHTVQGTGNSLYINLIGLTLNNPPQTLPPVVGQFWVNGVTMNLGLLPANGASTRTIPIPSIAGLVGTYVTFQSGTMDAGTGVPQFTNATDCYINP